MKKLMNSLNPPKVLVIGFAILILIGACLLTLPIATEDGQGLPFINCSECGFQSVFYSIYNCLN